MGRGRPLAVSSLVLLWGTGLREAMAQSPPCMLLLMPPAPPAPLCLLLPGQLHCPSD